MTEEPLLEQNCPNEDKIELLEEKKETLLNDKCEIPQIEISSKKRLIAIATIIAFLNPIFSGLIMGIWMLLESNLKKEGKIVIAISIIWGLIILFLTYLARANSLL